MAARRSKEDGGAGGDSGTFIPVLGSKWQGSNAVFCSLCACVWRLLGWVSVPPMRGLADHLMRFAPIGLCFAASLSLGNAAYLYISVAFVQMLKAGTPVATLLVSIVLGLERPLCRLAFYILLVSSGIGVACAALTFCLMAVIRLRIARAS